MGRTRHCRDWSWWSIVALACLGTYCPFDYFLVLVNSFCVRLSFTTRCSFSLVHLICFFFLQPRIDKDSLEMLSMECPRIVVNPKPSFLSYSLHEVPREALPDVALDEPFVKDIDPKTWAVRGVVQNPTTSSLSLTSNELSIAEKFRLAFAERDARLAPKRAKNARQQQRRAERDWMMSSDEAKAMVFASKATRSLRKR